MALKKSGRVDALGVGRGEDGVRFGAREVDELAGGALVVGGGAETVGEESVGGAVEWVDWRLIDEEGVLNETLQGGLWVVTNECLLVEDQARWALEDVDVAVLAREDAWRASDGVQSVVKRDALVALSGSLSRLLSRSFTGSFSRLFTRSLSRRFSGFFSRGSLALLDEIIVVATLVLLRELESGWAEHDESAAVGAGSEGGGALAEGEVSVVLADWRWGRESVALGDVAWPVADKDRWVEDQRGGAVHDASDATGAGEEVWHAHSVGVDSVGLSVAGWLQLAGSFSRVLAGSLSRTLARSLTGGLAGSFSRSLSINNDAFLDESLPDALLASAIVEEWGWAAQETGGVVGAEEVVGGAASGGVGAVFESFAHVDLFAGSRSFSRA